MLPTDYSSLQQIVCIVAYGLYALSKCWASTVSILHGKHVSSIGFWMVAVEDYPGHHSKISHRLLVRASDDYCLSLTHLISIGIKIIFPSTYDVALLLKFVAFPGSFHHHHLTKTMCCETQCWLLVEVWLAFWTKNSSAAAGQHTSLIHQSISQIKYNSKKFLSDQNCWTSMRRWQKQRGQDTACHYNTSNAVAVVSEKMPHWLLWKTSW